MSGMENNETINTMTHYPLLTVEEMAYAHTMPKGQAKFKTCTDDFIVRETLSFEPEGEGTHAYLYIEKTNTNTEWLARQLARFAGLEAKEIGYAGLKDRNAVTSQWFSINLELAEQVNWDDFHLDGVKILKKTHHRRKLKRGVIKYNSFEIVLRDIEHSSVVDLTQAVERIQRSGVPNYFAQQRFGYDYNNLTRAAKWFSGAIKIKKRADKSIILSAARSMIFNQMLSQRIHKQGWEGIMDGDIMMLSGSHSIFPITEISPDIQERFQQGDIHPTAALWGRGGLTSKNDLLQLEQSVADELSAWCAGLEKHALKQERRSARLFPEDLVIRFSDKDPMSHVVLSFSLPTGSYATSVLREIIQFNTF